MNRPNKLTIIMILTMWGLPFITALMMDNVSIATIWTVTIILACILTYIIRVQTKR